MTALDPVATPSRLRGAVPLPTARLPAREQTALPTAWSGPVEHRNQSPSLISPVLLLAAAGAVTAVWGAALWLSVHVEADETLTTVALFAHLAALVIGFGTVLVIDWCGLLWILGRRRLVDVLSLAHTCHAVIWLGLAALTLSGALLNPDLTALRTQVKLAVVLVLALNGIQAVTLQQRLEAVAGTPSRGLVLRSMASASVSQASWWTATVIGFHTHEAH